MTVNSNDVVISTRVRLARNIAELPFAARCGTGTRRQVVEAVKSALPDFELRLMDGSAECASLVERHVISPDLLKIQGGGVLIGEDGCSVMLNEEDHIRIQCVKPGLDLEGAYEGADSLDDRIAAKTTYAWSDKYGYLTSCPTNTGTGMRASVMVHLIGLELIRRVDTIVAPLNKLGFTVRGMLGEGSEATAAVYQISNQVTLGISEKELIQSLAQAVEYVVNAERQARKTYYNSLPVAAEDKVMRSLGILKYARTITSQELRVHGAYLNLGISLGLISLQPETAYSLMFDFSPATMAAALKTGEDGARDEERARAVRKMLENTP